MSFVELPFEWSNLNCCTQKSFFFRIFLIMLRFQLLLQNVLSDLCHVTNWSERECSVIFLLIIWWGPNFEAPFVVVSFVELCFEQSNFDCCTQKMRQSLFFRDDSKGISPDHVEIPPLVAKCFVRHLCHVSKWSEQECSFIFFLICPICWGSNYWGPICYDVICWTLFWVVQFWLLYSKNRTESFFLRNGSIGNSPDHVEIPTFLVKHFVRPLCYTPGLSGF